MTRSISRLVATLLLSVIISRASSRIVIRSPSRRYRVVSESSSTLSANGLPLTMLRNSVFTAIRSSSESVFASAWRNTSIRTGTFIVLAAWNVASAWISNSSPFARSW